MDTGRASRGMLLLVAGLALCAWLPAGRVCAEKITVDPNVASVSARPAEPDDEGKDTLDRDKRLDKKITFSAGAKPAYVVLDTLRDLSGVDMRAGQNEKDWLSRERKMNVFAKDIPLRDLMRSMARVMKYKWRVTGGTVDSPRYRFYLDRKAVLDAEREQARQAERREARLAKSREDAIADYGKIARLSPDEVEKLREKDPFRYFMASTGVASALDAFLSQCGPAADALRTGSEFSITAADLPDQGREAMWKTMAAMTRMEEMLGSSGEKRDLGDFPEDPSRLRLRLNSSRSQMQGPERSLFLGMIEINCEGAGRAEFPLLDSESEFAKVLGKAIKMIAEDGADPKELERMLEPELRKVITAASADAQRGDSPVTHPEDPELVRKVKLEGGLESLSVFLREVSDKTGFAVVSDSFSSFGGMPVGPQMVSGKEAPIRESLDLFTAAILYNWWRNGQVLELRCRDWLQKQSLLVPQEWLDGWRKTLEKTGKLELDDLVQIAKLSPDQLRENTMDDPVLRAVGLPWRITAARDALLLYGMLDPGQASAALAEEGLDLRTLSAAQWAQASSVVNSRNPALLQRVDLPLRLKVRAQSRQADTDAEVYTFAVISGSGDDVLTTGCNVSIPTYGEPKKQAAKDAAKPAPPAK